MSGCVLRNDTSMVEFQPSTLSLEKSLRGPMSSIVDVAVTPKCLCGSPVDRDLRNAYPGFRASTDLTTSSITTGL
ncbi:hypothetical protein TNCV_2740631 [Trichonephila clavipes]|nr:hypothetical protein TNCV_2740631 [Trichonephila clavipes]